MFLKEPFQSIVLVEGGLFARVSGTKGCDHGRHRFSRIRCRLFRGRSLGGFTQHLVNPFGLAILANEFLFGIWFMASAFAGYVLRKPGAATITEMIAALLEVFMGNFYGPIIFVSGFLQGIGTEAGFAAFRYRKFGWSSF